jgi:hypothetical protein
MFAELCDFIGRPVPINRTMPTVTMALTRYRGIRYYRSGDSVLELYRLIFAYNGRYNWLSHLELPDNIIASLNAIPINDNCGAPRS